MTMAVEGGEGSASRPSRSLPPGKTRYPYCNCTVTILTHDVDNLCRLQIVHDSYQIQVHPRFWN